MARTIVSPKACHAAARLGRTVSRALDDCGLTPAGYRLLASLTTGGKAAATVLAGDLRISRPTLSATLDWLERRGLVLRTSDPADGRRVIVVATPEGEAVLREADHRVATRLGDVVSLLKQEETASVVRALELLHDALDEDKARRLALVEDAVR